jgi:hypothetical protein
MANEITVGASLSVVKGTFSESRSVSGKKVTMTGTNATKQVQNIGTSAENLSFGSDIGNLGYAFLRNLDATNYLEIGRDVSGTFYPTITLKASEFALVRLTPGVTYQAKANTAACDLEALALED